MPAKQAAAKKKKKPSSKKAAGGSSRKKTVSRSGVPGRKKVAKRSSKKATTKKSGSAARKKTAKPAGASSKKRTSRKKTPGKASAQTRASSAKKSASKRKTPLSKKAVVAKPASSTKKSVPRTTTARSTSARPEAVATSPPSPPRPGVAPSVLSGPVRGFKPYEPKRGELYMSDAQLEHFKNILLAWKRELMEEVDRTMLHLKDEAANFPDPNDRATQESEFGLELRTRDRERKLLKKIDSALQRIEDKSYGYCEETGDEIGLRRLEARPVATLCVEAQERRELAERQFRDREDYYR
jgi:DnaK suppressor protein